ncbi:MAG: helix-turn-helix domain-containing protein [Magnetococcus sp. WYHC-3]
MPNPLAKRILELRSRRSLSQRGLADLAGISAAGLSQIESGQTSPSVATLEKLADALAIPIAAFFSQGEDPVEAVEVLSVERQPLLLARQGAELVPLGSRRHAAGFEPVLIRLSPGGEMSEQPFGVGGGMEFVWVLSGRAVLVHGESEYPLSRTQSVYYHPGQPHNWKNPYSEVCELIVVRSK